MKFYQPLSKISLILSILFFAKRLPLSYCIFNLFFDKLKNKKKISRNLEQFEKNGFVKIDQNFNLEVDQIKKKLEKKNVRNIAVEDYNLSLKDKSYFIELIKIKLDPLIKDLTYYYNTKPVIVDLNIWTNYNYNNELNKEKKDLMAESFHCDGYLSNYIKMHVNMEDVDKKKGPMTIVKKGFNRQFIKDFKYFNRFSYNKKKSIDVPYIFVNEGKKGDALLFDSSNCFHSANIPLKNESRTMMQLIFYVPHEKIDEINQVKDYFYTYKLKTKPHSIKKTFNFLIKYLKLKLKR